MRRDAKPIDCPQVNGKTIKALTIYRDPSDGTEIQIDFEDGTSFSCCVQSQQTTDARLVICGGPGEPELLHTFDLA